MRIYDPTHINADKQGYRYYEKSYGRSLTTRSELQEAFRIFFSAGGGAIQNEPEQQQQPPTVPTNVIESADTSENKVETTNTATTTESNGSSTTNPNEQLSSKRIQPTEASTKHISRIRRRTISNILVQLRPIRRWFDENKSLRFYASSLLIVYEGDVVNSPNADMTTVKMIDFGRVRREVGGDHGYITGLSNVRNMFVDLLDNDDVEQQHVLSTTPAVATSEVSSSTTTTTEQVDT